MSLLRIAIPLFSALLVSYSGSLLKTLYAYLPSSQFTVIGTLPEYERPCADAPESLRLECSRLFKLDSSLFMPVTTANEQVLGLGVGVLVGGSRWYCDDGRKLVAFYESGNGQAKGRFRNGLTLYQSSTIPVSLCSKGIIIISIFDRLNPAGTAGWKSGSLVIGNPVIVSWFKTVNDVFSSYIRAFLALSTLLLLLIYSRIIRTHSYGYHWYQYALVLMSIHFLASSSLLDFLVPGSVHVGYPLLMGGGSAGCALLILVCIEVIWEKHILRRPGSSSRTRLAMAFALAVFLVVLYSVYGGRLYAQVQWVLAIILLPFAVVARAPAIATFALFFNADVLANRGILAGLPTNTSTHFLIFNFVFDAFEWLFLNSLIANRMDGDPSFRRILEECRELSLRFCVKRMSTSMFTRDFRFQTCLLSDGNSRPFNVEPGVTQLAGSVITSRTPLMRVPVSSGKARTLKGGGYQPDFSKGSEFCIFPLIHNQKVLGTLNITNYPQFVLGDPSQRILLISLLDRILPRLSECNYRESMSPNIGDENEILSIESKYSAIPKKTYEVYKEYLDMLAGAVDCKIIVSRALYLEGMYFTYSSHNYHLDDARFLETHSPKIAETMVVSPSNVALSGGESVFLDDVMKMRSIYPDFLVDLFQRNATKSLLVAPIKIDGEDKVWGVVWVEFPNRLSRPDSDMKDLANFLASAVVRVTTAHLESEVDERLNSELIHFLPQHAISKIRSGVSPRESESGYLLNVDLAGSTALARKLGEAKYREFVAELWQSLAASVARFGFTRQMIIWDAFIFTRAQSQGVLSILEMQTIASVIDRTILERKIGYRGILHFGDITRDITTVAGHRSWGISGTALAESCKFESFVKAQNRVLLVTSASLNLIAVQESRGSGDFLILEADEIKPDEAA